MREKEQKSVFGSGEDIKENKQQSLQRSLFHAVQWVRVFIGPHCPFCCIRGMSLLPQNSTLPRSDGASSTEALKTSGKTQGLSELICCLGYGEEQCDKLFSSSSVVILLENGIKLPLCRYGHPRTC